MPLNVAMSNFAAPGRRSRDDSRTLSGRRDHPGDGSLHRLWIAGKKAFFNGQPIEFSKRVQGLRIKPSPTHDVEQIAECLLWGRRASLCRCRVDPRTHRHKNKCPQSTRPPSRSVVPSPREAVDLTRLLRDVSILGQHPRGRYIRRGVDRRRQGGRSHSSRQSIEPGRPAADNALLHKPAELNIHHRGRRSRDIRHLCDGKERLSITVSLLVEIANPRKCFHDVPASSSPQMRVSS